MKCPKGHRKDYLVKLSEDEHECIACTASGFKGSMSKDDAQRLVSQVNEKLRGEPLPHTLPETAHKLLKYLE